MCALRVRLSEMHGKHPKCSDTMETRPVTPTFISILVQGYVLDNVDIYLWYINIYISNNIAKSEQS